MIAPSHLLRFSHGNATNLDHVADGEADLVLTSPMYFSLNTESLLREPLRRQHQHQRVEREAVAYALSLRPAFVEIDRILKPTGLLILQTKDLRYGGWLIGLAAIHRQLIESLGFRMLTRFWWQPLCDSRKHQPRPAKSRAHLFRAPDLEEFQIYGKPGLARSGGPEGLAPQELTSARSPVWRMPGPGQYRSHPYQSPAAVVRRLIALYSATGDLVVDPFAGTGSILAAALELGRRAAGCEIDPVYAARAERRLGTILRRCARDH